MTGVNFFIILHYSLIKNEANRKSRSAFFFSDVFTLVDFLGFLKITSDVLFTVCIVFLVLTVFVLRPSFVRTEYSFFKKSTKHLPKIDFCGVKNALKI